jgi:hypothetical protein
MAGVHSAWMLSSGDRKSWKQTEEMRDIAKERSVDWVVDVNILRNLYKEVSDELTSLLRIVDKFSDEYISAWGAPPQERCQRE